MLTSDGHPPVRGNAHAHVEARAQTGRHLRAVVCSNAHARVRLADRCAAARGANLTPAKNTIAALLANSSEMRV